jgi:hypothetical protein
MMPPDDPRERPDLLRVELNEAARGSALDPERHAIATEPPAAAVAVVEALREPFDAAHLAAARAGLAAYLDGETREADRATLAALRKEAAAALVAGDVQTIARTAGEIAQIEARLAPPTLPSSPADLCRAIADRPTPPRLAMGIDTLDEACRGGIPAGCRVVMVGAPGAGKTTLATQWTHDWAIAGARVAYLVADTVLEPILVRFGQREGLCRDDLEGISGMEPKRAAWLTLADRVAALPLLVLDGADTMLEDAIAMLGAMPGDGPRVLFLDSLQRIRCLAADGTDTQRARMDTILDVLRPLSADRISVVALSEMGRGGYAAGDRSPIATLAAAKESGAIEYFADLQIGLRNVAGEAALIDVDTAKNRLGTKPDLRLQLDFKRAQFTETDRPPKMDDDAKEEKRDARQEKRIAALELEVDRVVLRHAGLTSKTAVAALLRGREGDKYAAITRREAAGVLYREGKCFRIRSADPTEAT